MLFESYMARDENFITYAKFLQTIGHIHSDIRLKGFDVFPVFSDEENPQDTEGRPVERAK